MPKQIWECWVSKKDGSYTLTTSENAKAMSKWGGLGEDPVLLYSLQVATGEEAAAIHSLRQGFVDPPYKPQGNPASCPKCGATTYPDASGECWRCNEQDANAPQIETDRKGAETTEQMDAGEP